MPLVWFREHPGPSDDFVVRAMSQVPLSLSPVWDTAVPAEQAPDVQYVVTVRARVDIHMLERLPNLRMVAVAFTGYDSVDLDACRQRGVAVYNVPAYSTDSVAELVLGLAVALARGIPGADQELRAGGWKRCGPGTELAGKVVGIIGTGTIGLRVAELFSALRCRLVGWSRTRRESFEQVGGVYVANMEDVLEQADILSIHVPLTDATRSLIGAAELARMKPTALLINTSRGAVVDQNALARALQEKRIGGAGLDVYAHEPLTTDSPLRLLQNVVLTPHIGFATREALERRARITMENIGAFHQGRDTNRIV